MKYSVVLLALTLILSNAENEHSTSHHLTVDGNNLPARAAKYFDCTTCDPSQIEISVSNPEANPLNAYYVPPKSLDTCDGNCVFEIVCDDDCYEKLFSKIGHVEHGTQMETDVKLMILVAGKPDVHKVHIELVEKCDPDDNGEEQDPTLNLP